jgi:arsenate reductase (thioredoxin)
MKKFKVLFVCIHNSARSQMAEAFLNQLGGDKFEAESAGLEPGNLNPIVVDAMKEIGIDISNNKTNSVFDFYKSGKRYHFVFTVCDEASGEKCPIFPGTLKTMHIGFTDPSSLKGTYEEKLEKTRKIRDEIKHKIEEIIKTIRI